MTEIVIHFGYPKTGSCALQEFLHENHERLRAQGVYYPKTGLHVHEHHQLAFAIGDNPYQNWTEEKAEELFDTLDREVEQCECDTVLISSELFAARLAAIRRSRGFRRVLDGNNVRAICFLRRQDRWLESCFKQSVWEAPAALLDDPGTYIEKQLMGADYYRFLSEWAEFLGKDRVTALVYEQALGGEGCIQRFCVELGIDASALGAVDLDARSNVSPGTLGTEIMQVIMRNCDLSDEARGEVGRRVQELESSMKLTAKRPIFSDEQRARIEAALMESNRRLASEFVNQPLDGFWFSS